MILVVAVEKLGRAKAGRHADRNVSMYYVDRNGTERKKKKQAADMQIYMHTPSPMFASARDAC